MVSQCSDYLNQRVEVPTQAWSKVGSNLFQLDNKEYVIIANYHSNYPDVYQIPNQSSKSIIQAMKECFGRFGIPHELVSDNGPCYSSTEFKQFAEEWDFKHITSSPIYPQSNGLAERRVKTLKNILGKPVDKQMGLLTCRSTQLDSGYTPSELNLGRRTRCNLPRHGDNASKAYARN